MADPFEEFEFKPLTEGLGFHKKNKKQAAPASELPFISKHLDLDLDLDEDAKSPLQPPLPREIPKEKIREKAREAFQAFNEPVMDDSSAAVEEILQTLRTKKAETQKPNIVTATAPTIKYADSVQNFSAFFLDSMLVLAATLLCMIVALSMTKLDAGTAFLGPNGDWGIYLSTFSIFAMVSFAYLVLHRVYLGATPGEWAYDQRIGMPDELGTARYTLTVFLRGLIIVATGIITLPIISMIMKKDIAGQLSGTQLLERV